MVNRLIPDIFNPAYWRHRWQDAQIAWKLLRDRRVPLRLKIIPFLVAIYIVSPFDLVPGFIPILGQMDDLALLLFGISLFIRLAPAQIVEEYRQELNLA